MLRMYRWRDAWSLACLALLLAGCGGRTPIRPEAPAPERSPPVLLLVSLDGVSPRMLGRGDTPHLDRLAREGVAADWMNPAYPTLTFPNHYSIVTGLRPDRHGIVHNTMRDAALGDFNLKHRPAVSDGRWWDGGEPLWVTAERAGLRTAVTSWPGSEAAVRGIRPWQWNTFDPAVTLEARIERVDAWLRAPAPDRPRLILLYFEHVDVAGHAHGPEAPEVRVQLRRVDAALGRLWDRVEARGQRDGVNLVVVSDHGMAAVPEGQWIATERMVDPHIAEAVTDGEVVGFVPRPGQRARAEAALLGRHARYACWRREALPERWHYGRHPRVPPIVCQLDVGWKALPRERIAQVPAGTRGSHGYAPEAPEMRAVFIARGPGFCKGIRIPAFDNVDLHPVLAGLLGVDAPLGDGRPQRLAGAVAAERASGACTRR